MSFKFVNEQEFLSRKGQPIQYIGVYELDWVLDDNLLDCEGVIVAFEDRKYLIFSKAVGEDDYEFFYFDFDEEYECRKILPSPEEPIFFIRKEEEKDCFRILRFCIGMRPILVSAVADGLLQVGISHIDINGDWLEFNNSNLLNDQ